ncbi:MAG: hypothetical protein JEY94_17655 [Melioribacteraceae bacterium]|nr:hypothetical protein [Melioribacteraceae bacterium]
MLLETLDVKTNDILIYSENQFDFENNFTIIYKNEKVKKRKKISYFDVCDFIKDPSPKNLIVYRLLTNVEDLESNSAKYGYFIQIQDRLELVYFDPIFAIRDLKNLRFTLDPEKFRFKIQQVGLTSLTKQSAETCYAETYHFDLHASEAQTQNDKIFADAIFALDDSFEGNVNNQEKHSSKDPFTLAFEKYHAISDKVKIDNITEDNSTIADNINPMKLAENEPKNDLRENAIETLKEALGVMRPKNEEQKKSRADDEQTVASLKSLIDKHKSTVDENEDDIKIDVDVNKLFRSTKRHDTSNREDEDIILRFKG